MKQKGTPMGGVLNEYNSLVADTHDLGSAYAYQKRRGVGSFKRTTVKPNKSRKNRRSR